MSCHVFNLLLGPVLRSKHYIYWWNRFNLLKERFW